MLEKPTTYTSQTITEIQLELRELSALGVKAATKALKRLTTPSMLETVKACDAGLMGISEACDLLMAGA